jgi:acyl carrier protein
MALDLRSTALRTPHRVLRRAAASRRQQGWERVALVVHEQVAAELHRLLERAGVDPADLMPATPLAALYLDSLDRTEILEAVRTRFGVDVHPAELLGARTVGEATNVIASKLMDRR